MNYHITLIVVLFAIFFIGISLSIYFMFFFKKKAPTSQNFTIINLTDNPSQIISGSLKYNLPPQGRINIFKELGSNLQANLISLEENIPISSFEMILPDEDINTIYLTYTGLRSNLTSINGRIWNNSGIPIVFVMVSTLDKRRWPIAILYPDEYKEIIIPFYSEWQVTLSWKDEVIASNLFSTEGSEIIFNGTELLIN